MGLFGKKKEAAPDKAPQPAPQDSAALSPEERYEKGRAYFFAGNYRAAAPLLAAAAEEGWWDACFLLGRMYAEGLGVGQDREKAKALFDELEASPIGERYTISFGTYPQGEKGQIEPVRWLVLDRRDDQLLLLSDKVLDARKYYDSASILDGDLTWDECDLRQWLNGAFLKKAFSRAEIKSRIRETALDTPSNEIYQTTGGASTVDRVFLLSVQEAQKYFVSGTPAYQKLPTGSAYCCGTDDDDAIGFSTPYAEKQGVQSVGGRSWWWLRSPGFIEKAAIIDAFGPIDISGADVHSGEGGVRPALWLDIRP